MPTGKQNLEFLVNTVIPHLEEMVAVEECPLDSDTAILDFDEYAKKPHWSSELMGRKITSAYNCGRKGCLAGWYLMMSEENKRLDKDELQQIAGFSIFALGDHFNITEHETEGLFNQLSGGVENESGGDMDSDWDEDNHYSTKYALDLRKDLAIEILQAKEEIENDDEITDQD